MAERTVPEVGTNGGRSNGAPRAEGHRRVAERRVQLLQLGPQVLPRGLPGDAGHARRAPHADGVPRQRRRDGQGPTRIEDVAEDYVNCTMCGACELRCPNTLFTGDFYRFRQRTIDVVKAMRRARRRERRPPAELAALGRADRSLGQRAGARLEHRDDRGQGPCLGRRPRHPDRRRDVLFADCEAAF